MKQFKQGDSEYIGIEVPEGASDFAISERNKIWYSTGVLVSSLKQYAFKKIPEGKYSIIGLATDLTEEQAKPLVDMIKDNNGNHFYDYYQDRYAFNISPLESLFSRLTSLGLPKNTLIIKKLQ